MNQNYNEVLGRMLYACSLKNESALAREMGLTPQALSNYKRRGTMPCNAIINIANDYGLSIDWLLSGKGEAFRVNEGVKQGARQFLNTPVKPVIDEEELTG